MACVIHPTAIVADGAELGVDVEVGPYSIIGPHVKIGDRSKIASHVVIENRTTLGPENTVFQFASLGAIPQDLKFKGEPATLTIGARNTIRECVTLHLGTKAGTMTTEIGDDNLFMANSHVAHDCSVGNKNVFANSIALAGHVTIMNSVILGGLSGIHQYCRVGDFAMIGAGAMVGLDVPPYCIAQGDRASLRGVNVIALERSGMTPADISAIRQAYRHLFLSSGDRKTKLASLPPELSSNARVQALLEFLEGSKRGVTTAGRGNKREE